MILTEQQQFESAINYIVAQINKNPQQELWYSVLHLIPPHDKSNALLYTTLQKLCSLHPQTLWPFVLMADYHLQQQDLLSAHRYLKKAVERSTPHTALHHELSLQLARIYYTQQQFTKMEKLLENVVNSRPSFAPACNLLAYYYALHTDQLNRADQLCKQSLQEEPQNPYFLYTQSLILYKQKAFSRAFNMVEHALSLLPNEHSFLLLLAKIERKQHNNSKAQNILNTLPKTELCIHDRQIFDHLATKLSYEKK